MQYSGWISPLYTFLIFTQLLKVTVHLQLLHNYCLYSPCCTIDPWAYLTLNSLYLPLLYILSSIICPLTSFTIEYIHLLTFHLSDYISISKIPNYFSRYLTFPHLCLILFHNTFLKKFYLYIAKHFQMFNILSI